MEDRRQRVLAITAVLIALPLTVALLPILLIGAALADAWGRLWRFPTVRLVMCAVVYLAHEWIGLLLAAGLRMAELVGVFRNRPGRQIEIYRSIQAWWASSLMRWAGRFLRVRFDMADLDTLPTKGFIVLSRHASMVDAVLPAVIVADGLDRFIHYVLKAELQWDANLNVYGRRLGNYFVQREGDGDAEAAAIAHFARGTQPDSALVIFPEGTYSTPARRAKVRASLAAKGEDELAALATELNHLLPPKPGGTLALLDSQPDLDVVVVGHVGLEGVTDAGLRKRLPLRHPVVVRWWVHERSTIPTDDEKRIAWLNDQWRSLDRWVDDVAAERTP
ncbi:MAG: 1-acyl-sn-glycerol-3-phosphate acyltransferase [Actinomycetota bacterium]